MAAITESVLRLAEAAGEMTLDEKTRTAQLQRRLTSLGHGLVDDGHFGPKTDTAVKRFQKGAGLNEDGIVGPKTIEKLKDNPGEPHVPGEPQPGAEGAAVEGEPQPEEKGKPKPGAADPSEEVSADLSGRTLFKGHGVGEEKGNDDVAALQGHLGIDQDGRFGPETEKAVKKFQRKYGMRADGIVGEKTQRTLAGSQKGKKLAEAFIEEGLRDTIASRKRWADYEKNHGLHKKGLVAFGEHLDKMKPGQGVSPHPDLHVEKTADKQFVVHDPKKMIDGKTKKSTPTNATAAHMLVSIGAKKGGESDVAPAEGRVHAGLEAVPEGADDHPLMTHPTDNTGHTVSRKGDKFTLKRKGSTVAKGDKAKVAKAYMKSAGGMESDHPLDVARANSKRAQKRGMKLKEADMQEAETRADARESKAAGSPGKCASCGKGLPKGMKSAMKKCPHCGKALNTDSSTIKEERGVREVFKPIPEAVLEEACRALRMDDLLEATHEIHEAKDSMKKASTPEPFSKSKTSNWVARSGGLPAYIQHIAHDLVEKRGKSESNAIQMAIGIVKRWARGGGNVDSNTKAAAAKAVAQWEALKAKNKAKKAISEAAAERPHKDMDDDALRSEILRHKARVSVVAGEQRAQSQKRVDELLAERRMRKSAATA